MQIIVNESTQPGAGDISWTRSIFYKDCVRLLLKYGHIFLENLPTSNEIPGNQHRQISRPVRGIVISDSIYISSSSKHE